MKFILVLMAQLAIIACNTSISPAAVVRPGFYNLQLPCGNTKKMVDVLETKYTERLLYKGKSGMALMRFYGNSETNTFTVGMEFEDTFCIVMAGNYLIKETEGTSLLASGPSCLPVLPLLAYGGATPSSHSLQISSWLLSWCLSA